MSDEVNLPTEDDLKRLSLRACVAYAVRASLRVRPLFHSDDPAHEQAVDDANQAAMDFVDATGADTMRLRLTRTILTTLVVSLTAAGIFAEEPNNDGFTALFDGKSLDGWHIMNGGKFSATEGVIKLDGGRGWLRSDKEYTDFVLTLEVRWLKPRQDSGVFLRASKEGGNWPNRKYEVQCENSPRIARIFGASHKRDDKLALKLLKEDQQWNRFEIKCEGPKCEVKFNGQVVATSDGFKNLKGYIGLQGESGQLEFRDIRIKTLGEK